MKILNTLDRIILKTFVALFYLLGITGIALMIFGNDKVLFIFLSLTFTVVFLGIIFMFRVWWNTGGVKNEHTGRYIKPVRKK